MDYSNLLIYNYCKIIRPTILEDFKVKKISHVCSDSKGERLAQEHCRIYAIYFLATRVPITNNTGKSFKHSKICQENIPTIPPEW